MSGSTIQRWYETNHIAPRKPLSDLIPRKQKPKLKTYRVYRGTPLYRKSRTAKVNPMVHLYGWLGVLAFLGLMALGNWALVAWYGLGL